MKKSLSILSALMFSVPVMAFAQGGGLTNIANLVGDAAGIVSLLIPFVLGLAVLAFFWGIAKYVLAAGNEEKKAEGRNVMIWGVVAIFVAVSLWGFVNFLQNALFDSTDLDDPTKSDIVPDFL